MHPINRGFDTALACCNTGEPLGVSMHITRLVFASSSIALALWHSNAVQAQDYPSRPVRIVTAAVGGGSDFTARQIAQGISGPLGQPVVVENRGSGIIQGEFLAKAPPDGYGLV